MEKLPRMSPVSRVHSSAHRLPWIEESLELHTTSLRMGVPTGDNAGMCPLWLLINTKSTTHRECTFDYLVERLSTPYFSNPVLFFSFLEWSFSHAHLKGTRRKCWKVLPLGHHCGEFCYIRDTTCLFPCLSIQKTPHLIVYTEKWLPCALMHSQLGLMDREGLLFRTTYTYRQQTPRDMHTRQRTGHE